MSLADFPILVTRAEPGASETAARLRAAGRTPILAPMLSLRALPDTPLPPPEEISGLVFTSANGVRTYADRRGDRHLPAWCVGPATAAAAGEAGFETVLESAGNAMDLARFITKNAPTPKKPLLHIANIAAAGTLKAILESLGFPMVFVPLYEMRPATNLPGPVQRLVTQNEPAFVLVHSEKGASAFAAAVAPGSLSNWVGVAISDRASAPLEPLNLSAIYKADIPNEDGLFAALETALATLSA
ncbi:MAG: uroporphyrinogen-III synthase [Henriciella sp.]